MIGDSREGWVEAVGRLLNAYVGRGTLPARWDTSKIRRRGEPLTSFGGVASGPEPLQQMLGRLDRLYRAQVGRPVDAGLIVDTMNVIGCAVAAGGTRRAAQIAFGEPDDPQFVELKQDASLVAKLKPLRGELEHEHELEARYCEGGVCEFV